MSKKYEWNFPRCNCSNVERLVKTNFENKHFASDSKYMFVKPRLHLRIGSNSQENSQIIIILRAIANIGTDFTKIYSSTPT